MSHYPENAKFECWIKANNENFDAVGIYLTENGLIFMCAPYVDCPCFDPSMVEDVCSALKAAAEKYKNGT